MRLIDFFVFYEATLYKSKEQENRDGNQRLNRAMIVASSIIAVWLLIIIQIVSFLSLKINFLNERIWKVFFVVIALIIFSALRYIYVSKQRYQYIISEQYPAFKLGKYIAITIMLFTLLLSIALSIGIGIYFGGF